MPPPPPRRRAAHPPPPHAALPVPPRASVKPPPRQIVVAVPPREILRPPPRLAAVAVLPQTRRHPPPRHTAVPVTADKCASPPPDRQCQLGVKGGVHLPQVCIGWWKGRRDASCVPRLPPPRRQGRGGAGGGAGTAAGRCCMQLMVGPLQRASVGLRGGRGPSPARDASSGNFSSLKNLQKSVTEKEDQGKEDQGRKHREYAPGKVRSGKKCETVAQNGHKSTRRRKRVGRRRELTPAGREESGHMHLQGYKPEARAVVSRAKSRRGSEGGGHGRDCVDIRQQPPVGRRWRAARSKLGQRTLVGGRCRHRRCLTRVPAWRQRADASRLASPAHLAVVAVPPRTSVRPPRSHASVAGPPRERTSPPPRRAAVALLARARAHLPPATPPWRPSPPPATPPWCPPPPPSATPSWRCCHGPVCTPPLRRRSGAAMDECAFPPPISALAASGCRAESVSPVGGLGGGREGGTPRVYRGVCPPALPGGCWAWGGDRFCRVLNAVDGGAPAAGVGGLEGWTRVGFRDRPQQWRISWLRNPQQSETKKEDQAKEDQEK